MERYRRATGVALVMALPQTNSNEREERLPPGVYPEPLNAVAQAQSITATHPARHRAQARSIAPGPLVDIAASVFAGGWRWLARSRNDLLNRRAGKLYQQLAQLEFGAVRVEQADLPDEFVTRLVIPLRGEDLDRKIQEIVERVSAIHDRVEETAPELVGRIVFDYSSDARPS